MQRAAFAAAVGTVTWLIFTGIDPMSWLVGIPAILLAAWSFSCLTQRVEPSLRWGRVLVFLPRFAWISLLAGWDVARRVPRPSESLDPGLVRLRTRLPEGLPRIIFGAVISLVPGTLLVHLEGQAMIVHVVDIRLDNQRELRHLEADIGRLFGLELSEDDR